MSSRSAPVVLALVLLGAVAAAAPAAQADTFMIEAENTGAAPLTELTLIFNQPPAGPGTPGGPGGGTVRIGDPGSPSNVGFLAFGCVVVSRDHPLPPVTTSLDTASNTICGSVTAFSPFAVFEAAAVEVTVPLFLHAEGTALTLDESAPTSTTAKFRDSAALRFAGGNPWKEIGTWTAGPATGLDGTIADLGDLHVWIGLKNSDDQGTRFDVRAELFRNGSSTPIASGEVHCIRGVTRNAAKALEVSVPFGPLADADLDPEDALSLKVSARIGTDGNGGFCGGHSNAVGLRLYFDAVSRPAQLELTLLSGPPAGGEGE